MVSLFSVVFKTYKQILKAKYLSHDCKWVTVRKYCISLSEVDCVRLCICLW